MDYLKVRVKVHFLACGSLIGTICSIVDDGNDNPIGIEFLEFGKSESMLIPWTAINYIQKLGDVEEEDVPF